MNKHVIADWARTTRAALKGQGEVVEADTFGRLSEARAHFAPLFAPLSISCAALSQEVLAETLRAHMFFTTADTAYQVPLVMIGKGPVGHHSDVEWPMVRISISSHMAVGSLVHDALSPNRNINNRELVLLRDYDAKWLFRTLPSYAGAVIVPPLRGGLDWCIHEWANLHTYPFEWQRGFTPSGRAFVIHRWLGYLLHLGLVIRQSDFYLHGKRLNWPRVVQALTANQDLRDALHTTTLLDKTTASDRGRAGSEWSPSQSQAMRIARLLVGWLGADHGPHSPLTHYWQAQR